MCCTCQCVHCATGSYWLIEFDDDTPDAPASADAVRDWQVLIQFVLWHPLSFAKSHMVAGRWALTDGHTHE